ncbi:MAG: hypothetical protein KKA05_10300 [Alphaproteobacteria bacterium]|nr:hypothetical protein [Alphaproteobacteria bacterium]
MRFKANLTLSGHRVTLEAEVSKVEGGAVTAPGLTIDLEPIPADLFSVSLSGDVRGPGGAYMGGQISEELAKLAPGNATVSKLITLWERLHLSGMNAGTREQLAALAEMPNPRTYEAACAFLKARGLLESGVWHGHGNNKPGVARPYRYGEAWLYAVPSRADIDALRDVFERLDGLKIGEGEGPETVEEIAARLGLTVESAFVPFSQSRNKGEKQPSLNWRVTLMRGGHALMETDYSAGVAYAPGYKVSTSALTRSNRPLKTARALLTAWECEKGVPGEFRYGEGVHRVLHSKPIKPDAVDVIASLALDSAALTYGRFESWAEEMCYDADSRSAESIYRQCVETAATLTASIGASELEKLQEAASSR